MLLLALPAKALQDHRPCSALAATSEVVMASTKAAATAASDKPRPRMSTLALVLGLNTCPRSAVIVLAVPVSAKTLCRASPSKIIRV